MNDPILQDHLTELEAVNNKISAYLKSKHGDNPNEWELETLEAVINQIPDDNCLFKIELLEIWNSI